MPWKQKQAGAANREHDAWGAAASLWMQDTTHNSL